MHKHDDLEELQKLLGVAFRDVRLLDEARTDKSVAAWCPECVREGKEGNKLLEFLGDTTLNFVLAHEVMRRVESRISGDIRRLLDGNGRNQSGLRTNNFLGRMALRMGLGPFIHAATDKGPFYGSSNLDVLANAVEAIVEAIRMDQGGAAVAEFVSREILCYFDEDEHGDPMVIRPQLPTEELRELLEEAGDEPPSYQPRSGSEALPGGLVEVWVWSANRCLGRGRGVTEAEAGEEAARRAILEHFEWTDDDADAD